MITQLCLRFEKRRGGYRQAGEPIRTSEYEVAPIDRATAKTFVRTHHYSHSFPAAVRCFGLFRSRRNETEQPLANLPKELVGVAAFSVPMGAKVLKPFTLEQALELGRFVLLDEVPGNGESWFIARCFELLRVEGWGGIVSFSDPEPIDNVAGRIVFGGHIGTIYQATNAVYTGLSTARTQHLLPDGLVFSERAISKIRNGERGWLVPAEILSALGAGPAPLEKIERRAWLTDALGRFTRPRRHRGSHRYLFALNRAARRVLKNAEQNQMITIHPYPRISA